MNDNEQNNFSLGFVVGALVGVAGYFFTSTQEGKEIKKKVANEWGIIRKKLEDEGAIPEGGKDFSDIIVNVRTKIYEFLDEEVPKKKRKPGRKSSRLNLKSSEVLSESPTKKRKRMFKGI
ncbi:YtxH domain-containing protein [Patescibacteria group bacterium]|nr:YtxH domain-containing protein [Patescibacteria group bacterium]